MINNISLTNIEAKARELTEILNEKYYPWFAEYMVMKRWKFFYPRFLPFLIHLYFS